MLLTGRQSLDETLQKASLTASLHMAIAHLSCPYMVIKVDCAVQFMAKREAIIQEEQRAPPA